jgi:hypothetical protein
MPMNPIKIFPFAQMTFFFLIHNVISAPPPNALQLLKACIIQAEINQKEKAEKIISHTISHARFRGNRLTHHAHILPPRIVYHKFPVRDLEREILSGPAPRKPVAYFMIKPSKVPFFSNILAHNIKNEKMICSYTQLVHSKNSKTEIFDIFWDKKLLPGDGLVCKAIHKHAPIAFLPANGIRIILGWKNSHYKILTVYPITIGKVLPLPLGKVKHDILKLR